MGAQVVRRHFLERRGEGVGIILNESEGLSGKTPVYELFGEELRLTIFAAKSLQEERESYKSDDHGQAKDNISCEPLRLLRATARNRVTRSR